jgi:hypothetical protein
MSPKLVATFAIEAVRPRSKFLMLVFRRLFFFDGSGKESVAEESAILN